MNKFVLLAFLSFIVFFTIVPYTLAVEWQNWENEVPKACGDFSSDCDSCGQTKSYKTNIETKTTYIPEGTWLIKASAENIEVQTSCWGSFCNELDCSVKATRIDIKVTVDGIEAIHEPRTGSWALAEGDQEHTASSSVSSIYSDWEQVTCGKYSCKVEYIWEFEIYGYADSGFGGDHFIAGEAQLDAIVEWESAFEFSLSISPTSGTVTQGGSTTTTVTATLDEGSTESVRFDCPNLPTGISCSFSQDSCNPTCQSTLTISTDTSAQVGTHNIIITGTGGGMTETTYYTLTVNQKPSFDFSIAVDPNSGTINQGDSTKSNVTLKLLSGDTQSVSLSTVNLPTGVNIDFNPSSLSPTSNGVNSTMTISTDSSVQVGTHSITIKGTAGSLTKQTTYTLTVNQKQVQCTRTNPTVTITPSSKSGTAGSTLQYTVRVSNSDSGSDCTTQTFSLSSGCPSEWSCSFGSSSLSIGPGASDTTTISVTSPSTTSGSNSFTVIATSGSYTSTSSATYIVSPDCTGSVDLTLTPSTVSPEGPVTPSASGLSNCDGTIEFRKDSCDDDKMSECSILTDGCSGSPFTAPSSTGTYTYYACVDKNNDGDFEDDGESDSATLSVAKTCPRDNPDIRIDPSAISKEPGESHTFTVTVTNDDYQTCDASTFTLSSECPSKWSCKFGDSSLLISPKNSASTTITVKSSSSASGKYLINLTAVNSVESKYNATASIGFTTAAKCDSAGIKITDAYFYENRAVITVENNGTANNLTISSAVITDKTGKKYYSNDVPITNFDASDRKEIVFSDVPNCDDFNKVKIATDCPEASDSTTEASCRTIEPEATVKIDDIEYKDETVKITLKNIGSNSIDSESIKILIDGEEVECEEDFELAAKSSDICSISDFTCTDTIALVQITEPNEDESEFKCEEEIEITPRSCKDEDCNQYSRTFTKGEKVYINVGTESDVDVSAVVYHDGESERIDLSKPYEPTEAGTYTVNITASKEGQKTVETITFTVEDKESDFLLKVLLIALFVIILTGFVYYRLKKTKKREKFDELYEKYKRKSARESPVRRRPLRRRVLRRRY